MALTQDAVLTFLLDEGGKVPNSELLTKFKGLINPDNAEERKQNRELFKRFVNNIAVVKDEDGVKYIVIRKKFQHLVKENAALGSAVGGAESAGVVPAGEGAYLEGAGLTSDLRNNNSVATPKVPLESRNEKEGFENRDTKADAVGNFGKQGLSEAQSCAVSHHVSTQGPAEVKDLYVSGDHKPPVDRGLNKGPVFAVVAVPEVVQEKQNMSGSVPKPETAKMNTKSTSKPYSLPLRCPPPQTDIKPSEQMAKAPVEEEKPDSKKPFLKVEPEAGVLNNSPRTRRRQFEEIGPSGSPHLKRVSRTVKQGEEPKMSEVPLDPIEHEWLVKAAAGQWTQVYGLLLKDINLAEKRDFISGFTALHWAAKSGNSDMISKIIEISRIGGAKIDVNARTYGGYTPLHIAAIHGREEVIIKLIREYSAKMSIRDYSGKKPYQYLNKTTSLNVKRLLGDPHALQECNLQKKPSKISHSILSTTNSLLGAISEDIQNGEPSKGFKPQSLSKLFNPPTISKKKNYKHRAGFSSIAEDNDEEKEDNLARRRPISEFFL
ncbi:ankyrin repeat domain-containing protein SOWAHA [Polypterus senegalus]